jgi:hypothetical protein
MEENLRFSVLGRRSCDETLELLTMFVERPLNRSIFDRLLQIEKLLHEEAGIDVAWAMLRNKENDDYETNGKDGQQTGDIERDFDAVFSGAPSEIENMAPLE